MQRTVGVHIRELEKRRDTINAQIMEESDVQKRNQLDTELRAVQLALKFYREALETERRLFAGEQIGCLSAPASLFPDTFNCGQ